MTDAEWMEFGKATLHGPPPWVTLQSIFATVDRLMTERDEMQKALTPLVAIADAYDANNLDAEARKFWGEPDKHENKRNPADIELYSGRGGLELLTLAHCLVARRVVKGK
jgi:hypothetical protein